MKPQQHSYWNWSSRIERIAADRLEDVADRFCELLDRAVRERMQDGRVATHLSGGMDSSAVTILARRTAETEARDPIATISLTHDAAELAAERSYIKLVLNQGGPVDPHFISADEAVGFDWFRCPMPEHHEPYAGLWSLAANRLLVDVANHCRVKSVLTGAGADEILTYRPLHIADLLRRGRLISAIREAARWAEGQGQGIWTVLRQCGFGPLCPSGFRPFSWPLRWLGFTIPPRQGRWSIPPWIRADFVRKHQLHDRNQDFSRRLFAPPAAFSETLLRLAMASGDWARWHLYAPLGINISHPFLDPRVVCYALGIPRHVRAAPGDPKPLLRTAMQGLLPDAIQNRREKTGFDGPHARGMALHLTQLEELVWNSPLRDLGIVDPGKLISAMHQVAFGIGSDDNQWIDRTLALMAWSDANKRATVEYGRNNTVQSLVANPCC